MHTKKLNFACKFFFFKKCLFEYENQFAVEKTQKNFGVNFKNTLKNFCRRHQKNASHTFSIYQNCMVSILFGQKYSFLFSTMHRILCQNKRKVFRKFDDTILAKCMISIFS